jgi:6-pyruvoyl-tetrahydropterin synthase
VKFQVSVATTFEGGHVLDGHSLCGKGPHGHSWTVTATVEGTTARSGLVVDPADFRAALAAVTDELDGREIVDMAPGIVPSPEGVAAYVAERLLLAYPRLASVSVAIPGLTATALVERR